jgi:hypothetical protein
MTKQQLARWKRLSLGLAKHHGTMTDARRNRLCSAVEDCIDWIVDSHDLDAIKDWDGCDGSAYVCDDMSDFMWERRYEMERRGEMRYGRFGNMVGMCVRAGFDLAVAPSVGVLGFCVSDLRKVFPRGIPTWVNRHFEEPITVATPDHMGVWL